MKMLAFVEGESCTGYLAEGMREVVGAGERLVVAAPREAPELIIRFMDNVC